MDIIATIAFVLFFSFIFSFIFKKIKIPNVVALILFGLVLNVPSMKEIFIESNSNFLFALGDIALVSLMFIAGLETSWTFFYKEKKDAVYIAVFAWLIPFLLGFAVFMMLGFSLMVSLIVSLCLSITAEATKARVLLELNKIKTRLGAAMMGAGIIDDILGLLFFVLITYAFGSYFIEDLLIVGAIIAFFTGIMVHKKIGRKHNAVKSLERLLMLAVIPFFFVSIGIHFDLNSLMLDPLTLLITIIIAITGKLIGTFLTKPFNHFRFRKLLLIGWGMNSRGAIGMALALIAFRNSIIPIELYSSLVIMALTTTIIFPFIVTYLIRKDPHLMD